MTPRNLTRELAAGKASSLPPLSASEETLVADLRSGLTLAQMIECRFVSLLQRVRLPINAMRQFHPTAIGQIAQGVTRFEVFPLTADEFEARSPSHSRRRLTRAGTQPASERTQQGVDS